MKTIYVALALGLLACTKATVTPTTDLASDLVGKWNYAYQQQEKKTDGTWTAWTPINTFVALPTVEYTTDKKILENGLTPSNCCGYQSYSISGNKLTMSDLVVCPNVKCNTTNTEFLFTVQKDTLVLESATIRTKLFRVK